MNIIRLTAVLGAALMIGVAMGRTVGPAHKIASQFVFKDTVQADSSHRYDAGGVGKEQWMLFVDPHIHVKSFPKPSQAAQAEPAPQPPASTDESKAADASKSPEEPKKTPAPFSDIVTIKSDLFSHSRVKDLTIKYDSFIDCWVVTGKVFKTGDSGPYDLIIAISGGDPITPATPWYINTISAADIFSDMAPDHVHYQQLAIDHYNISIGVESFDAQGNYIGAGAFAINKPSLFANIPAIITTLVSPPAVLCPVTNFDQFPQFGYFISPELTDQALKTETSLRLYRVINPQTLSPQLSEPIALPSSSFVHLSGPVAHKDKSDLFVGRLSAHIRNKQLFISHTVLVDKEGKSSLRADRYGIRIYQFDLTGDKEAGEGEKKLEEKLDTTPALIQEIILCDKDPHTPTPKHFWNGTVMSNRNRDLVVSALVAGHDQSPAAVVAGRLKGDPAHTIRLPLLLSYDACGDASALVLDQNNGVNFWSINEFIKDDMSVGIKVTSLVSA